MVCFAITFSTLIAFAGLALEYNRWQQIATRAQKAADAAALGGAVFMPENVGNKAFTTAQTIASQNGFTNGSNGVTITTAVGGCPTSSRSPSRSTPTTRGARSSNYNNTTIVRSAVAEYQLPQNLGSPQNSLRERPGVGGGPATVLGQFVRPLVDQVQGRRHPVGRRERELRAVPHLDRQLQRPAAAPVTNQNRDYDANGYFYGIDVPAGTSGALNVQVFDPAFVHVGDTCGAPAAMRTRSMR